jgi:pimeloyl-ACP methyl ester carboxylesterase
VARIRRLPLVVVLCATLTVGGCSLPFTGDDERRPPATRAEGGVDWRDCADVPTELVGRTGKDMTYQCATIEVPRDWTAGSDGVAGAATGEAGTGQTGGQVSEPAATGTATGASTGTAASGKLRIALLRARSTKQSDRIGSLVINPGGPGGSGIEAATYLSFGPGYGGLPDEVTRRFDLVGFDPRGVGRSTQVDCVTDADLDAYFGADPDPVTQSQFDEVMAISRRIGQGCGRKYGDALAAYSTEQAARDMDAVRAAVGDEKLTYLGYSYGTLLGATYAQLFPNRVRAFVLDGAVDPRADTVSASEAQARGFEQAFGNFADWCRRTPKDCPVAPDARAALTSALARARVSPTSGEGGRRATAGWVFWAVVSSLYTRSSWEELAKALDNLAGGDPKGVFELADRYAERDAAGRYGNMFDAFFAVNCADEAGEVTPAQARQLQSRWRAKYPIFGAALAAELLTCAAWPGEPDPYPTGAAQGAPPIVVVGTTGDPATPYEQTAKLADMLGVGRVLTVEGEGHTAYPEGECVTRAVNAYLLDLTVPAEGLRCPAR